MSDNAWIYDAPPPPPPVSAATRGARGGRGQRRNQRGQPRQQFQPAMSFDNQAASLNPTGSAPYGSHTGLSFAQSQQHIATDTPHGHAARAVVSYDSYYASPNPQPVSYNEAGYALSSTYHPTQRADVPSTSGPKPKIPPPLIQGTDISLDTPEDIAKWIAERKRKWPTDANVEKNKMERAHLMSQRPVKKRKMQQKKGQTRAAEPQSTLPAQQAASIETATIATSRDPILSYSHFKENREQEPQKVPASSLDIALAALTGTIEAETSSSKTTEDHDPDQKPLEAMPKPLQIVDKLSDHADSSGDSTSSSDISDSDSCESDSDVSDGENDAPETVSSKPVVDVEIEEEQAAVHVTTSRPQRVCKYFRQGRCTRGDNCTFSHTFAKPKADTRAPGSTRPAPAKMEDKSKWRKRKSLYERLVESELEKEREAERIRIAAERGNIDGSGNHDSSREVGQAN